MEGRGGSREAPPRSPRGRVRAKRRPARDGSPRPPRRTRERSRPQTTTPDTTTNETRNGKGAWGGASLQATLVSDRATFVNPSHAPHEDGRRAGRRRALPRGRPGTGRAARARAALQGELDRARRGADGGEAKQRLAKLGLRLVRGVRQGRAEDPARDRGQAHGLVHVSQAARAGR